MNESMPSRATIDRHLNAVYPPLALLAGVRLDVFTPLENGAMTVADLARALEVDAFKLETLLYALVMAEMLTVEDGRFTNSPQADHYLVQGRPGYIGHKIAYYAERWAADLMTAESIREGVPQGKLDFTSMSDAELTAFYNSGHAAALATGRRLAEDYGPVTAITRRYVHEARMDDRVKVVNHDVVDRAPEGRYDVAVMANFIQVLTRDQARRAVLNIGNALAPRGVVLIIGWVLDDSQISPPEIAASNFTFLNIYDEGRAFTEVAHRAWLVEAGFTTFERTLLSSGESIIRAEKAG
jgi:hypothetical protein